MDRADPLRGGCAMTWLTRLSLTNRAIVGLITTLIIVLGAISTMSLRQELLPSIDIPAAFVVTENPGASPEVVEQQVTTPIEAAVGGITGVTGTSSTSTGASSVVTVDLEYGSDLAELTSQLQRAVQGVVLPAYVDPKVVTGSTDNLPVVQLGVSSNLGNDRVAAVLSDDVRPLLAGLDGVADVTLSGIREPRIVVDVDTDEAADRGVSVSSILSVLKANGVRVPAGQLTPDTEPLTVEVGSQITSVEQLRDLYITPSGALPVVLPVMPPGGLPVMPPGGLPVMPPGGLPVMPPVAPPAVPPAVPPGAGIPTTVPSPTSTTSTPTPSPTPSPSDSRQPCVPELPVLKPP